MSTNLPTESDVKERLGRILAQAGRIAADANDIVALRMLDVIAAYDEKNWRCKERTAMCYLLKLRQEGMGELAATAALGPLMQITELLDILSGFGSPDR